MTALLDTATEFYRAGCSVVPVRADGSKAPAVAWKKGQEVSSDLGQIQDWFSDNRYDGLGVITGAVSGHLEMLELEGRAIELVDQIKHLVDDHGLTEVWHRLNNGYREESPSGGWHWLFRTAGPAHGNTKIARRPSTTDELETHKAAERAKAQATISDPDRLAKRLERIESLTPEGYPQVLIETRGEGGFTVTAPSAGRTHPTRKAWVLLGGTPGTIPTLTVDERDRLYDVLAMLDTMPAAAVAAERAERPALAPTGAATGTRPGDDFNARGTWEEILEPWGWLKGNQIKPGEWTWTRPGKSLRDGPSATTGMNDGDNLYVFSSSTEFDTNKPYDKFAAFALIEHGGSFVEAARDLRSRGYGSRDDLASFGFTSDMVTAATAPPGPPASPPPPTSPEEWAKRPGPPPLDVSNPGTMTDWLRTEVGRGQLAGMFLRGNDIVETPRVGEGGYIPLKKDNTPGADGPAQVRVVSRSALASHVQYSYTCIKWRKANAEEQAAGHNRVAIPAIFPMEAARVAADVPHRLPNLRRLNGVTHAPVVRPDGSLLADPGYDETTGLLHLPEVDVPPVDTHPTPEAIAAAVGLLDEMTDGFSFESPHDRANYYGLLLTPLLRLMAPAPYKLMAINSPQPGSGKTLLATVARAIHGGVFRAEIPEEVELRKQVTAMLTQTTGALIHFDNVSGTLRSSTLAGLLTSATWGDRPLGETEWVGIPNDRIWVITGNNIHLGGDLVRRTVWISIDPGVPNPERRTGFAIANLERWATEHRGPLLHALLTLIRGWVAAGRPPGAARSSDGYSHWTQTITGILSHAGVAGIFDADDARQQEVGADDDEWIDFLQAVHETFGDQEWSVKELLDKVDDNARFGSFPGAGWDKPIKLAALPADLQDKAMRATGLAGIAKSLGNYLRNRKGRWAGPYTVRYVGEKRARERFWRVETRQAITLVTSVTGSGDTADTGDSSYNPRESEVSPLTWLQGVEGRNPEPPVSPVSPTVDETCPACRVRPHGPNSVYCAQCIARANPGSA